MHDHILHYQCLNGKNSSQSAYVFQQFLCTNEQFFDVVIACNIKEQMSAHWRHIRIFVPGIFEPELVKRRLHSRLIIKVTNVTLQFPQLSLEVNVQDIRWCILEAKSLHLSTDCQHFSWFCQYWWLIQLIWFIVTIQVLSIPLSIISISPPGNLTPFSPIISPSTGFSISSNERAVPWIHPLFCSSKTCLVIKFSSLLSWGRAGHSVWEKIRQKVGQVWWSLSCLLRVPWLKWLLQQCLPWHSWPPKRLLASQQSYRRHPSTLPASHVPQGLSQ